MLRKTKKTKTQTPKILTAAVLKKWKACRNGYDRFNELFPKGADLKTASEGLIADNHLSWSNWLWEKCKQDPDFCQQTVVVAANNGTATAGYNGTATAGYNGTATAGDNGTAIAGYMGTATAGDNGTATAGASGTATAGDRGTATAGDRGTATAGDRGTAMAGYMGTAMVGPDGMICIKHWTGERLIIRSANVGLDGIEANVPYQLSDDGTKFVKVQK